MDRLEELKRKIRLGQYNPDSEDVAIAMLHKVAQYRNRIRKTEEKTRAEDRHQQAIHEILKEAV